MTELQKQAELQRNEAKALLSQIMGLSNGVFDPTANRLIDCIIGAAICEVTDIMFKGINGEAKS